MSYLDPGTVEQLRRHRWRQVDDRAEWGTNYKDGDLVFWKENGEPLHPQTYTKAFERLVSKTELPTR